jgi:hypothetical protein
MGMGFHNYLLYSTLFIISDLADTFVIQVANYMEERPIEKLIVFQVFKKYSPFMKPENILIYSQEPILGPYLEPDVLSYPSTLFL